MHFFNTQKFPKCQLSNHIFHLPPNSSECAYFYSIASLCTLLKISLHICTSCHIPSCPVMPNQTLVTQPPVCLHGNFAAMTPLSNSRRPQSPLMRLKLKFPQRSLILKQVRTQGQGKKSPITSLLQSTQYTNCKEGRLQKQGRGRWWSEFEPEVKQIFFSFFENFWWILGWKSVEKQKESFESFESCSYHSQNSLCLPHPHLSTSPTQWTPHLFPLILKPEFLPSSSPKLARNEI